MENKKIKVDKKFIINYIVGIAIIFIIKFLSINMIGIRDFIISNFGKIILIYSIIYITINVLLYIFDKKYVKKANVALQEMKKRLNEK